jgi:UDP-N-acetylglucosamine 4,6-dehydratase
MSTYLITGGAGSLGREIVDLLIQKGMKVRAMDICESGLAELTNKYPHTQFTAVYGDIRDYTRIHYAMRGCDVVIHTAALKNLDITEGDVPELILTNVNGTTNVAKSAVECGVDCAILISTDKACQPQSAYGASKLLAEWVWRWASRTQTATRFAIFRSGNFKQSAGNVLEVWGRQAQAGESLTVTDPDMERYFIDTQKAAKIVCGLPGWCQNGDICVPKMQIQNIIELLEEHFPGCSYKLIGKRPGEKQKEVLMTEDEKVIWQTEDVLVVA